MRLLTCLPVLIVTLMLAACGDKPAGKESDAKAPEPSTSPNLSQKPDAGKVEAVSVTSKGSGASPSLAVNEALKSAILQVNGTTMSMSSSSTDIGLDVAGTSVTTGQGSVTTSQGTSTASASAAAASVTSIRGREFAERIVQNSKGAVTGFSVLESAGPDDKGIYTVSIEAKIAKFKAPADAGRIRIVVAPVKTAKASYSVGGTQVASGEVQAAIRQQLIDALSQTGRFTILDREFAADVAKELDMISSGETPNADFAKLGQALGADLIWVGTVNDLSYSRSTRKLPESGAELISFGGAWSLSQRLINVATRQIAISTTLEGKVPSVSSTTTAPAVNVAEVLRGIEADIVKQATDAIVLRTFPISVVEREGNAVVLSQGGKALAQGARLQIFLQGKEIKDPQTGQSLGNMESLCCELVIERVTPSLSYGRLENIKISLEGVKPGALQVREAVPAPTVEAKAEAEWARKDAELARTQAEGRRRAEEAAKAQANERRLEEEKLRKLVAVARAAAQRGDYEQALANVNNALAIDPANREALTLRAQIRNGQ